MRSEMAAESDKKCLLWSQGGMTLSHKDSESLPCEIYFTFQVAELILIAVVYRDLKVEQRNTFFRFLGNVHVLPKIAGNIAD